MNWIHCNKCNIKKANNTTIDFFCGSCSHVLCRNCSHTKTCPIDNRPFNGVKICQTMPDKLRVYFEDPNNLLTPWQKCIRFQFEQRTRCESMNYAASIEQMRRLKKEIKLLHKAKSVLNENIEKDTKRNNKMKAYLKYCMQKHNRSNRSLAQSRASTSSSGLEISSTLGESGVGDMNLEDLSGSI